MFSGLVAALGSIAATQRVGAGARLAVTCELGGEALRLGESIAVQGVCLTVAQLTRDGFASDLSSETLSRTTLGSVRVGQRVNLERALRLGDRVGGHIVLGHVDAAVPVSAVRPSGEFANVRIALPSSLQPEVAEKGSIAIDGVSLTVSALGAGWFEVVLIAATRTTTTLGELRAGARVNLETDVLAKYARSALAGARPDLASLLSLEPHAAD